jgi:hypothetical protein
MDYMLSSHRDALYNHDQIITSEPQPGTAGIGNKRIFRTITPKAQYMSNASQPTVSNASQPTVSNASQPTVSNASHGIGKRNKRKSCQPEARNNEHKRIKIAYKKQDIPNDASQPIAESYNKSETITLRKTSELHGVVSRASSTSSKIDDEAKAVQDNKSATQDSNVVVLNGSKRSEIDSNYGINPN